MNCRKCGNIINNTTTFCPICGEQNNIIGNSINQTPIINNTNINKKKIFIPIIIIIGLIMMFFVGLFVGKNINLKNNKCDKNENVNNTLDDNKEDGIKNYTHNLFVPSKVEKEINTTELGKNITINEIFFNPNYNSYSKYKKASFYGKNNNSIPVDLKLILEYYDSEGYRIEKNSSSAIIYPGKEFVIDMTIEDDSLNYSKVKLSYEVNQIKSYYKIINEKHIKMTNNLTSDGINILVENKYSKKINGNIACLYYKDNKMVFAQQTTVINVEPNLAATANCYEHLLHLNDDYSNLKKIEYDDFKVILFSVYNYDSTNY